MSAERASLIVSLMFRYRLRRRVASLGKSRAIGVRNFTIRGKKIRAHAQPTALFSAKPLSQTRCVHVSCALRAVQASKGVVT